MVTSAGGSLVLHLYASIKSKTMMRVSVYVVSLSPSLLIIWSVKVSSMKLTTGQHLFDKCDITRPHDGHVILGAWRLIHLSAVLLLWKFQTVLARLLRTPHHYVGAKCLLARQISVVSVYVVILSKSGAQRSIFCLCHFSCPTSHSQLMFVWSSLKIIFNLVNNHFVFPVSFEVVGYGCMTCIGNSGPLPEPVVEAITQVPGGCFHLPTVSFHVFKHSLALFLPLLSFFFFSSQHSSLIVQW